MDASYLWCLCLWTFQEWVTEGLQMPTKRPEGLVKVIHIKEEDEGRIRGPCWVRLRGLIEEEPLTQYSWSIFKAASHMLCIGYGQVRAPWTSIHFGPDRNRTVRGAHVIGSSAVSSRHDNDCNINVDWKCSFCIDHC